MGNINIASIAIGLAVGAIITFVLLKLFGGNSKSKAAKIIEDANNKAKSIIKDATLDGKQQVYDLKLQAEKEFKERKQELQNQETKLLRREDSLNFRDQNLTEKEKKLDEKLKKAEDKSLQLDKMEADLQSRIDGQIALLEKVSHMSEKDAHDELMAVVESKMQTEIASYIHEQEEAAKARVKETTREIIATAIQRYSQEETTR